MDRTTMQTIPNQRNDVAKLYLLTKPAIFEIFLSHESSNLNSSRMKRKQVNYRKTIKINNYEHIWHTNIMIDHSCVYGVICGLKRYDTWKKLSPENHHFGVKLARNSYFSAYWSKIPDFNWHNHNLQTNSP